MKYVLVGKFVKTHGIKGEIKIRSNFKYKDKVFIKDKKVIINNQEFVINTYRVHQEYDMLTFKGINNINQIIDLKGNNVYIEKDSLNLNKDEYLDSDLIGLNVYINDKSIGSVSEIVYINNQKKLLVVSGNYIPFELIKNINFKDKIITVEEVLGLV